MNDKTKKLEYKMGKEENLMMKALKFTQIKAAGWYLEWNVNMDYLLVIKSTSQEDEKLVKETEQIKDHLQSVAWKQSAYAFKSYTIEHPTE